jgi:hypothetical protein
MPKFLKPLKNNFVERPWGGTMMREFKRLTPLPDQRVMSGMGLGEAFEIAAFDTDTEARQYPSRVRTVLTGHYAVFRSFLPNVARSC